MVRTNGDTTVLAEGVEFDKELVARFQNGDEAALETLIERLTPLVRFVLNRTYSALGSQVKHGLDYEDLLSEGMSGLIYATRRYDARRGSKFSTYAVPRIRGAILDALRSSHPLPRALQKLSRVIDQAVVGFITEQGRQPNENEIAESLGVDTRRLLEDQQVIGRANVVSLTEVARWNFGSDFDNLAKTADEDPAINPEKAALGNEMRQLLYKAVRQLPDREQTVIRLYYGPLSLPLHEIGKHLGISESRASQLRIRAVRRLRSLLTKQSDDGTSANHRDRRNGRSSFAHEATKSP